MAVVQAAFLICTFAGGARRARRGRPSSAPPRAGPRAAANPGPPRPSPSLVRARVRGAVFVFCAFGAYSAELDNLVWLGWTTGAVFSFLLLVVDCLFSDATSFIYDPDPEVRARRAAARRPLPPPRRPLTSPPPAPPLRAQNWRRQTDTKY